VVGKKEKEEEEANKQTNKQRFQKTAIPDERTYARCELPQATRVFVVVFV